MKVLKRFTAAIATAALVCTSMFTLVACAPALEGIEVTKAPTKTQYVEGQKFDTEGMEISAVYSNQTTEIVTDYTYEPAGELATSDTEITITYNGKTITQEITVIAKDVTDISITSQPAKTEYKIGEKFDASGMVLTATYNDNSKAEITDYTIRPSRELCANDKNVYISYGETTIAVPVTVTAEEETTYPKAYPVYKARGSTDLAGQKANINFTFYSDYTVKGLLESGMGAMVDNMLGNFISLPGVWERTDKEFYVIMNDFTFDPSTLEGLAGFVGDDMKDMFESLVAMDPIDIKGCMSDITAKSDGSLSYDLVIEAMGIQAPFTCTGKGAPDSISVKAGEAIEAEYGDISKMAASSSSSSATILSANAKASHGYQLQYTAKAGNEWSMKLDVDKAKTGAEFAFYIAAYKKDADISDYITVEINGKKADISGALSSSSAFVAYNVTADLLEGENTVTIKWILDGGVSPNIKFDYFTVNADVVILNPSLGEL